MLPLMLLVCGAEPVPVFVVENKVPPFVIVNRIPTTPKAESAPMKWVAYSRAPVGHTHTCTRCGVTWDHQENPAHTCANCGQQQFIVDQPSRPVTLWKQVPKESEPLPPLSLENCPTGH